MTVEQRLAEIRTRLYAAGDQYPEWESDLAYVFDMLRSAHAVVEAAEHLEARGVMQNGQVIYSVTAASVETLRAALQAYRESEGRS